ncbi:serine/threonine-protein phosphatase 6 catalytic subunit isoform X2 [Haliaeetus albicilla]|uniref:serine/threonine-protein phosphatase 6 catalytic subunit isoform X2 n=1 Tax=Haliaeetus albicilla TaxID=8969 RepID=UPI0037E7927D
MAGRRTGGQPPGRKRLPPSGPAPAGSAPGFRRPPRRPPEVPGSASCPESPSQDGAAGPGQVRGDRSALQVPARERPQAPLRLCVRPAAGGVQCPARLHARHRLRGHPRAVLRPVRAVQDGRSGPRHQLHLHDECQTKYGNANAWRYCTKVFDMLTIAALIDEQILCVHGGLSPDIKTLDQIRTIERNQEIPHKGAFCDLVWSDPEDVDTWAISPRGAGWLFGAKVTNEFVHINNLKLICRAHQLVHEGYKFMFDEKLVTVWSAPNYCYRCGNIASIMVFKDVNTREPKLFRAVPDSERVIPPRTTTPYFL